MEEGLSIPIHGGENEYTYALRRDWVYLCIEKRLIILMYGGELSILMYGGELSILMYGRAT